MAEALETTTSRPTLGGAIPILRVESLDASVAYYVEQLGFTLQWRSEPVASVHRDRASLMLRFGADVRPGEPIGEWLDGEGRRWSHQPDGEWRRVD